MSASSPNTSPSLFTPYMTLRSSLPTSATPLATPDVLKALGSLVAALRKRREEA